MITLVEPIVEPWDAMLASSTPRPDSEAQAALRRLVGLVHPRWRLVEGRRSEEHWPIEGWFNSETGHHDRIIVVHFDPLGRIAGWSLSRCGAWGPLHDRVDELAQTLRSEALP